MATCLRVDAARPNPSRKVDRLTRSLADFAKIVERFDARGVSFVSVTQAFNTTTSMGRLTLNVLLSFARFEREVTGERIRDKIKASKQKGMWMGGIAPLGYDPPSDKTHRALVVNEAEAEQVRSIFRRYLELGSVHVLRAELAAAGVRSKSWTTSNGRCMGGAAFSRGALFHLLKNRVYLGVVKHGGEAYPGLHAAIVDAELLASVQTSLKARAGVRHVRNTQARENAPLTGLIFDTAGRPMSPTTAYGKGDDATATTSSATSSKPRSVHLPRPSAACPEPRSRRWWPAGCARCWRMRASSGSSSVAGSQRSS